MRLLSLLLPPFLALAPAAPVPGVKLTWEADLAAALERAADGRGVVFVALDHEGEARCEAFLKLVGDKDVAAAAEGVSCVPASSQTHGKRDTCKRFKGLACADHQRTEADLVGSVLAENDQGTIAVPQYLWLDGRGEVLLSVTYEIDRAGLLWCFETARQLVDPEGAPARSEDSRPPRRLLMGSVFRPVDGDVRGRGMTPDELELAMDGAKSNLLGLVPLEDILEVVFTDEPDAVGYAVKNLGFVLESFAKRRVPRSLHTIGTIAPARFWEVVELFAEDDTDEVRHEAAVALEQLGARDGLKLAKQGWKDEERGALRGAWLRALAASGAVDKATRKTLLKVVGGEDEPRELRAAAAFALGYLERHDDVREAWSTLLEGDDGGLRVAAACGVALARDEAMLGAVETALVAAGGSLEERAEDAGDEVDEEPSEGEAQDGEADRDDSDAAALARARAVLLGGDLAPLEQDVQRVTGDDLDRERIFFRAVGHALDAGPEGRGGGR